MKQIRHSKSMENLESSDSKIAMYGPNIQMLIGKEAEKIELYGFAKDSRHTGSFGASNAPNHR